jgi:hypothetical protein
MVLLLALHSESDESGKREIHFFSNWPQDYKRLSPINTNHLPPNFVYLSVSVFA